MKREKVESIILIVIGLIIIASGLYIYFVANTIYPDTNSSRVRQLNWLLKNFGKNGTTILISIVGAFFVILGFRRLKK